MRIEDENVLVGAGHVDETKTLPRVVTLHPTDLPLAHGHDTAMARGRGPIGADRLRAPNAHERHEEVLADSWQLALHLDEEICLFRALADAQAQCQQRLCFRSSRSSCTHFRLEFVHDPSPIRVYICRRCEVQAASSRLGQAPLFSRPRHCGRVSTALRGYRLYCRWLVCLLDWRRLIYGRLVCSGLARRWLVNKGLDWLRLACRRLPCSRRVRRWLGNDKVGCR
mmetsp:Transcript_46858/g.130471  ORF Transcript_46858/g.130471 Transcript_46858/m.130471 type:complete len:225 (-) Transcript_46858:245-919(-)